MFPGRGCWNRLAALLGQDDDSYSTGSCLKPVQRSLISDGNAMAQIFMTAWDLSSPADAFVHSVWRGIVRSSPRNLEAGPGFVVSGHFVIIGDECSPARPHRPGEPVQCVGDTLEGPSFGTCAADGSTPPGFSKMRLFSCRAATICGCYGRACIPNTCRAGRVGSAGYFVHRNALEILLTGVDQTHPRSRFVRLSTRAQAGELADCKDRVEEPKGQVGPLPVSPRCHVHATYYAVAMPRTHTYTAIAWHHTWKPWCMVTRWRSTPTATTAVLRGSQRGRWLWLQLAAGRSPTEGNNMAAMMR